MNENSIANKAVKFAIEYEKNKNRRVIDVQSNRDFNGFDIISISKDGKNVKTIEVKGTTKENGIPDCFETEFTRNKKLVATHMYVVYFFGNKTPVLYVIPASAFKQEYLKEILHYRINSTFKNKILPKYRINN